MRKGRVTIPTDENYVEGTKKIADLWGADAVRDCDGTHLPKNALEIAENAIAEAEKSEVQETETKEKV